MPTETSESAGLHRAWGLNWRFPFSFPELPRAPDGASPDVTVLDGSVPAWQPAAPEPLPVEPGPANERRFHLPGTARILVRDGRKILVDRVPGARDANLRLLLVGTGAALVLHQRGVLPLHASGILGPRGAVLFLGHSGAGKSTLLAEFLRRGYRMLSEDLAAVRPAEDGSARVDPGVQALRLWGDSLRALGRTPEGLDRVREEIGKFLMPADPGQLAAGPAPLQALYALSTHNGPGVALEALPETRTFNLLLQQTWMKVAVRRMGQQAGHFKQAVALARGVRGVAVRRPQAGFRLQELADAVEADFSR